MKIIGFVGGLSWVSSLDYYRHFNEITNQRLGGNEAAKIAMYSVNYGEIVTLTHKGDWDGVTSIIGDAAKKVEAAGADCILLGANTMHHIAERVQAIISIPLLHIADVTAKAIQQKGIKKVALLGTRYTMQFDFFKNRLANYGITTLIPDTDGIEFVNNAIYNELGRGIFLPGTRQEFLDLIDKFTAEGAQGVILGCTEIPMLIKQADTALPVFDTTLLHATAAVDFALT